MVIFDIADSPLPTRRAPARAFVPSRARARRRAEAAEGVLDQAHVVEHGGVRRNRVAGEDRRDDDGVLGMRAREAPLGAELRAAERRQPAPQAAGEFGEDAVVCARIDASVEDDVGGRVFVAVAAPGIFNVFYDASTQQYNAAAPGDAVEMFITGDGDVSPSLATGATPPAITAAENLPAPRQPVSLTVGGVAVTPLFVGIPSGLAGVTQINFTVPAGLAAGAQPVVVTVGGVASPAVNLKIVAATAP